MLSDTTPFTIGVEEEYQIIDPQTRTLSPSSIDLLTYAQHELGEYVQLELQLSQIEAATAVCHTLHDVRRDLTRLRKEMNRAAGRHGKRIVAAGTHPFAYWKNLRITPRERYLGIAEDYQQIAREAVFGCHVHIGVKEREMALRILNRARPWLSILLALAANSPFWQGEETGYASFRTLMWSRWPTAGPPQHFASLDDYDGVIRSLVNVGNIENASKIYWDVRLSERLSTIEFRVMDTSMTIDESVMQAGLIRALVYTCYQQEQRGEPLMPPRQELLRTSHWHAARYGLSQNLIDVLGQRSLKAREMVEHFLQFLRPALEEMQDWEEVSALVEKTLREGNGAARQLAFYQGGASIEEVVDYIASETVNGLD